MSIPATREWVDAKISKSIRAAVGEGGDKPPKALSEMTDVVVESPSDDQALLWDSASSMWMNKNIPAGTKNYNDLANKPSINGKELIGDVEIPTGGTEVEANPEGTATEDLKKIKIGENIFSIPEGGSGGSTHKYSTEEKVVGEWIDGEPIYEITSTTEPEYYIINKSDEILGYTTYQYMKINPPSIIFTNGEWNEMYVSDIQEYNCTREDGCILFGYDSGSGISFRNTLGKNMAIELTFETVGTFVQTGYGTTQLPGIMTSGSGRQNYSNYTSNYYIITYTIPNNLIFYIASHRSNNNKLKSIKITNL